MVTPAGGEGIYAWVTEPPDEETPLSQITDELVQEMKSAARTSGFLIVSHPRFMTIYDAVPPRIVGVAAAVELEHT